MPEGPEVHAASDEAAEQLAARVPWLVVLLAAGGTELRPDQRLVLGQVPMEPEPVDVVLATRYDDVGLLALLPRELVVVFVETSGVMRPAVGDRRVVRAVGRGICG